MTVQPTGVGDFTATTAIVPADLNLDDQSGIVITAGTSQSFGPYVITSPSYAIALTAITSASATIGIAKVTATWTDSATGLVVDAQVWYVTGSTAGFGLSGTLTTGRGPSVGDTLTITIANFDPAQSMTVDYALWQSSRIITRHDWRTVAQNGTLAGVTAPLAGQLANVPAWVPLTTIAANGNIEWQCPLYAGQAQLGWQLTAVTSVTLVVYVMLPDQTQADWPQLWIETTVAATGQVDLLLPRCPVQFKAINGNSATTQIRWALTIGEYAS